MRGRCCPSGAGVPDERHVQPGQPGGRPSRCHRVPDPRRDRRPDRPSDRGRERRLPAGVRTGHQGEPPPHRERPEPGGVPSVVFGILGLVLFVQALRSFTGPDSYGRSYISGALTLAVLVMPIVILVTMEPCGASPRASARRLRGRGHAMGGRPEPRAPVRGSRHLHGHDPLPGSCVRRDGSPPSRRRRDGLPVDRPGRGAWQILQEQYTALPTQIFAWSKLPGEDCRRTPRRPSSCCWP